MSSKGEEKASVQAIPIKALFRPLPSSKAEPPPPAPPAINWRERYTALEQQAATHLAEAEARHQLELDTLKTGFEKGKEAAAAALAALDHAFAHALAELVAAATEAILAAPPPLAATTLMGLVEEILASLPEGSVATLYHAPALDPAILPDTGARRRITLKPDPALAEGSFRADVGVGSIRVSLVQRLTQLVQEIAAA